MAANRASDRIPSVRPIYRLIRRTRRRLRSSWVATGLALTVGLLLGTVVGVTLLDLAAPLGSAFRLVALLLILVPAGWTFLAGVVVPLFRRLAPGHVARRIEAHLPGIHNRLVSCLDLARNPRQPYSPAFYRRLVQEALERIRGFRPRVVVDFLSLRRAGLFAAASAAALVLAWVLFSDRLPTAMARIFSPFADIPPASGVKYSVTPGDARVLRGEDIPFLAQVEKGDPDRLRLELWGEGGPRLWYDLQKQDARTWKFTLSSTHIASGYEHGFRYRVHGGGTWSREYRIDLLERPALVELHTVLHYPEYMGLPEPQVGPPQTADVAGPEGSRVEVVVQAEGDVAAGEIQWLKPQRRQVAVADRPERVWFEEQLPAGARPEGTWQWDARRHQRPTHTEPPFVGTHQHLFQAAAQEFAVKPGESLFAHVFVVPGQEPEAIMLQWHDGSSWEHRAYWGEDRFRLLGGQADTPSRRRIGPLPPAGQWVRLEVPAEWVGLEGKSLRGMAFTLHGGQCFWYRAGALPSGQTEVEELVPARTFPLQPAGANTWSGCFPLTGEGPYRVELRNELGYPNKTMKEGRFVALPDNPPQVVLERPGSDLVLTEPAKVPLVIAAYDDFGLADLTLAVRRGDRGGSSRRTLKQYARPQRSDTAVAALDLAALGLKPGEPIRYWVEARDRKGQVARTREFLIRLAADPSGADRQLASFEKNQDAFREKLIQLIAQQAKVRATVEKLDARYAPLSEKIKRAGAEARPATSETPRPDLARPQTSRAPVPELDPEAARRLEALRRELGGLAGKEQQNEQLGRQIAADLKGAAEQAARMPLLPPAVADEMQALHQLFQQKAVEPLHELAARMAQGKDPKQEAPDLKAMKRQADRLQKELEALRQRLEALARARKALRQDVNEALTQLQRDLLRQDAALSAQDLAALKEFITALRQELKRLEGNQEQLLEANRTVPELLRPELNRQQAKLEKEAQKPLAQTREIQKTPKLKKMRRRPRLPNAPYIPDSDEELVPPREEDPDEPEPAKAKGKEKAGKDKKSEEDEELFMPALGGPRPKLDPRFAGKRRPLTRKARQDQGDTEDMDHEQMGERQAREYQELNAAEQSLASDEQSLHGLLRQLQEALDRSGAPASSQKEQESEAEGSPAGQDLAQLLRSQALQEALAMAARMRHIGRGMTASSGRGKPGLPVPSRSPLGNLEGTPRLGPGLEAELGKLDPATRSVILKMQPRLREELLQGMREEGPEGYRPFIQDYFRRLSKEKGPK